MQHQKTRGGTTGSNGKQKTSGANRDNGSSRGLTTRSQRAPTSEQKKRVGRIPELEIQLARLQEELEKAHLEADEAKKRLTATTAKLDELWACEESRIIELRKISQDRDRAWESELKAVQKHLTAALTENQKLNIRLQKVAESEPAQAKQADELLTLRLEHSKTLELVEKLKIQLDESKQSELQALERFEMIKAKKDDVAELGPALAANAELESELRRLKVQTEQWRKAAEVAAAMVLGEGGKNLESFDIDEKPNSQEDTEDESLNKKTNNMLKKLGVLLKKGQK